MPRVLRRRCERRARLTAGSDEVVVPGVEGQAAQTSGADEGFDGPHLVLLRPGEPRHVDPPVVVGGEPTGLCGVNEGRAKDTNAALAARLAPLPCSSSEPHPR
jgi:hypothetical protein